MANSLSEFEMARYNKLAKKFVEVYVMDTPAQAGFYILGELKEDEELSILREFVVDAFKEEGFTFNDLEKVLTK